MRRPNTKKPHETNNHTRFHDEEIIIRYSPHQNIISSSAKDCTVNIIAARNNTRAMPWTLRPLNTTIN